MQSPPNPTDGGVTISMIPARTRRELFDTPGGALHMFAMKQRSASIIHRLGMVWAAAMLLGSSAHGLAQMRGDPGTYQRPIVGGPLTADDLFDPAADAGAAIDAAIARAQARGRHTMIIFGGAWCHDSRALVDLFQTERFEYMLWPRYELVYVNVPMPRGERDHLLAHRFGLGDIVGTPTILILGPDGAATNLADAPRWRNAASRKPDAIFRHFRRAAPAVEGP